MSDEKQTDLTALISLLRAGGVFHAEFHEDGSLKIITLGPDPSAGGGDAESDDEPKKSALREHAHRLQFGKRVA
jgi:hypothetical protein